MAFDFDGTIVDCETIDEIAKLAGVEDRVSEITKRAMEGEVDFKQALLERVRLLRGLRYEDVLEVVRNLPLVDGIEQTLRELRDRGYKLAMITSSFDIAAEHYGRMLGFDYVYSNSLEFENGLLTGRVSGMLLESDGKARALIDAARREGISTKECAAIGDGANDIHMFRLAGLRVGFRPKPICLKYVDFVIHDIRRLLRILPDKRDS